LMAGSLLFPATPLLSLLFTSLSHLSHARQEHQRQCPVCKTMCMVKSVVPIYVNRHTARHCGGEGEMRMGGEDCHRRQLQDDPDLPRVCGSNGPKGATMVGRDAPAPLPTSTAAMTVTAIVAGRRACCCCCWWQQRRGDNAKVTMATMVTTTSTMACTVMATARAMVRVPRCNRRRCLC
jgi:hypothetical protein